MKLVLVGITLLVATIAVGVGCGPKEKYCYEEMDTCRAAAAAVKQDAETPLDDGAVEASAGHCFNAAGVEIPCDAG